MDRRTDGQTDGQTAAPYHNTSRQVGRIKTHIPTENSKTKGQHKNATKNFDYKTIADRLRTVSWSNNSHPTGVVKPVNGYPTFPLTTKGQQAIIDAHAAFLVVRRRGKRQTQCRSIWVRRWLSMERRLQYGQYGRLMAELRMEDVHSFLNFLRMKPQIFDELLNRVGPQIQKNNVFWRKSLEPGLKLAITFRHLAAGDKLPMLQFSFRVARNKISTFIPQLCQAIVEEYKDKVITCPIASNEWRDIAKDYQIACRYCKK